MALRPIVQSIGEKLAKQTEEAAAPILAGQEATAQAGMRIDPVAPADISGRVMQAADESTGAILERGRTLERNLNFNTIETTDQAEHLLDTVSHYTDNAGYQRVTFEQMRELAEDADDVSILTHLTGARKAPQAERTLLNAPQMARAKQLLLTSSEQLMGNAQRLAEMQRKGAVGKAELFDFQRQVYRHIALQNAVQGEQRELARALTFMRDTQRPVDITELEEVMRRSGGEQSILAKVNAIANAADGKTGAEALQAANEAIRKTGMMQHVNSIVGWRTLQLLSSPVTHARNILGNSLTMLYAPLERVSSGVVGSGKNAVRRAMGKEAVEQVYVGESMQMFYSYITSMTDAFRLAAAAGRRGNSIFGAAKVDELGMSLPTSATAGRSRVPNALRRTFDWAAMMTSWPGRALTGEDEFFKVLAFNAHLRTLAYRQAKNEGLSGANLWSRVNELQQPANQEEIIKRLEAQGMQGDDLMVAAEHELDAATRNFADLYKESEDFAHYQTFTDKIETNLGQSVLKAQHSPAVKLIIPFARTPMNLMSYAAERSPLALATPRFYREVMEGGVRRDMALSRLAVGSGVAAYLATYVSAGNITGAGPKNPALRRTMEASGWRPYSIRIGDKWVSYRGLEPVTTMMGTMGNISDAMNYAPDDATRAEIALIAGAAMAESMRDASFMQGLDEFFTALENIDASQGASFAGRTIASFLPQSSLLRVTSQQLEAGDIRRSSQHTELWGRIENEVKKMVPGLYDDVPPMVDALGQIPRFDESVGWDFVSPVRYLSPRNPDTEFQKVQDLININRVPIPIIRPTFSSPEYGEVNLLEVMPDPNYTYAGERRGGQGWVFFDYQLKIGEARLNALKRVVNSREFEKADWGAPDEMPELNKAELMLLEVNVATAEARAKWIDDNEHLLENYLIERGITPVRATPGPRMNVERAEAAGIDVPVDFGGTR